MLLSSLFADITNYNGAQPNSEFSSMKVTLITGVAPRAKALVWGLLSAALIQTPVPSAYASLLGDVVRVSAVGEPLLIELRSPGNTPEQITECIRVFGKPARSPGLDAVSNAQLSVQGSGPHARLIVQRNKPAFEPIIQLTLLNICNPRLQREYTLFLEPPLARSAPTTAPQPARTPETTQAARSIAPRPVAETKRNTERSTPPAATPVKPSKAKALPPQPVPRGPNQTAGRLVLEGDQAPDVKAVPVPVPAADGDREDALAEREAILVAAIDQTIKTQLELMDRLRRLEEVQAALKAQLEATAPAPAPLPATERRTAAPAAAPDVIPSRELPAGERSATGGSTNIILATLAGLALLAALLTAIRRRRDAGRAERPDQSSEIAASAWPDEAPTTMGERTAFVEAEAYEPRKTTRTVAPLDFDTGTETSSPEAETLPPVTMADEPVEEHDSAVELADIMISFGRVHGAAETLADFIRSNPRQAVTPWLKLMEVYRLAGMRMEFDALARQLNKTFNVKAVTWDNFDEARKHVHTLEQMPHLIDMLTKSWGTRDCQAFLEKLLRDNRDGLREGFPISIIDEILTLSGVLEEQIGRYRPDPTA